MANEAVAIAHRWLDLITDEIGDSKIEPHSGHRGRTHISFTALPAECWPRPVAVSSRNPG